MSARWENSHLGKGEGPTRDKNGRPFCLGDIVKVFHFTGARRKRHYMYKQVVSGDPKRLWFSHLDAHGDKYPLPLNGGLLEHYEIVQGWDDFEARPCVGRCTLDRIQTEQQEYQNEDG